MGAPAIAGVALPAEVQWMDRATPRAAFRLSAVIAALMAIASASGLFLHPYRDAPWIRSAWFGNDLVTLLVAVPLLVWALSAVRRGSRAGQLVRWAMLGYSVYNYAFYLFGAKLNALFPLYVALFVLPAFALILSLGTADLREIASGFAGKTPVRLVSGYMLFTGLGLGVAWLGQWAAFVFAGTVPSIGEDAFSLVAALDLSFMVPLFLLGGVLLWRRAPWGYVLGAIMTVKGATYTLVLTVSSLAGARSGVVGAAAQIPVWAAWTLLGAAAAALLFRGLRAYTR